MKDIKTYTMDWAGRELKIETGKLAGQAMGSCTVQYGDTIVLATAVRSQTPRDGIDYFPLMVDYEERFYAAGKISGSRFIKREGRPSEEAVLNARLVDRALRPLFDQAMRVDVQVILTVLSIDEDNDPDVPAMVGAACALMISEIPWQGPLASVRMGLVDDKLVANPTYEQRESGTMEVYIAGTDKEVVMLESGASQIPEDVMYDAIEKGLGYIKPVVELLTKIQKEIGKEKVVLSAEDLLGKEEAAKREKISEEAKAFLKGKMEKVLTISAKSERMSAVNGLKEELVKLLEEKDIEIESGHKKFLSNVLDEAMNDTFRSMVLDNDKRPDGRKLDELRELSAEVALIKRTHGTGFFARGETQALSIVTLGSPGDEQMVDGMEVSGKKRYMHHYNMPPYSVGEVFPLRGASRREIGHGALVEKALVPVLPSKEDFPYTIRVVSEIMSSNGSTSQASVCGSTLSLMDAGVPLLAPVAGISAGLVVDPENKENYKIIADIQGFEDHAGFMDFKVAGTDKGITAIQLDIKFDGITLKMVKEALESTKNSRTKILDVMNSAISAPRADLSEYAPRIESFRVDPEKIGDIIGPGGKVINKIIEETEVAIDIEDDGLVMITSRDADGMKRAVEMVKGLVREVAVGEIFEGTVTQIMKDRMKGTEIGAIVSILPNQDGMVHISELTNNRVATVSEVLKVGDKVKVKVKDVDKERGRISLSRRALLKPEPRTEAPRRAPSARPPQSK